MSIFKRGMSLASCASRRRFGSLARWSLLGLLAGCAGLFSTGKALAVDNSEAIEALIKDSVDPSSGAYNDVGDAITQFTRGELKSALSLLKDCKRDHKLLPPAEVMLARLLVAANQGQAARQEFEAAVKAHPEDPEAYLVFADQAFSEGRVTDAALLFGQAKTLAATFTENKKRQRNFQIRAEAGLAAVAEQREQWDDAKAHLEAWLAIVDPPAAAGGTAAKRDPSAAAPHDRLGRVLFKMDKTEDKIAKRTSAGARDAYAQFKMAVDADEKSISADIAMAQLYEEVKDHEWAANFIKHAVETKINNPATKLSTMIAAARWALDTDQADDARTYATMALEADKDSPEAKFLRGVAARLVQPRETDVAEKLLGEIYAAFPMNFSASNQYAQVLAEQNDKVKQQKALEIARMNDKVFGGQTRQGIETAATLGWVLYNMQQIAQADQVMQAIVQTGSPSADSLYYRARILQDAGKTEDAVRYLKAAVQITPMFIHRREAKAMLARLAGPDSSDEGKKKPKDTAPSSDTKTPSGKTDLTPAGK